MQEPIPTASECSPAVPPGWPEVGDRIKQALPSLKGANRKIALCILEDPQSAAFLSVQAMARLAGVHEASIVRFVKTVGFAGYADFKKTVQEGIKRQLHLFGEISMRELSAFDDGRQLEKLVQFELDNIRKTLQGIQLPDAARMIGRWEAAECIHVAGFGATKYIAQMFGYLLNYNLGVRINHLVGSFADYIGQMHCIGPKDVVLIASLPPYSKEGVQIARFAQGQGAKVTLFTDSPRSPVFPHADDVVLCANASLLYTSSYASLMASFKILMDLRLLGRQQEAMKRMELLNEQELHHQEGANPPEA